MTIYYFSLSLGRMTPSFVRVSKYVTEDRSVPDEVYKIILGTMGETCTCPSYKVPCKHVLLLRRWWELEHSHEWCYDDKLKEFIPNPYWIEMGDVLDDETE